MKIEEKEIDEIFNDDDEGKKLMNCILKFEIKNQFSYEKDDVSEEQRSKLNALNETIKEILDCIEKDEINLTAKGLDELIKSRNIEEKDYPNKQDD